MKRIGFIGAGNMAEAIIKGLVETGNYEIRVTNRANQAKLENMVRTYHVIPTTFEEVILQSEILVLAVKPKDVSEVLSRISKSYNPNNPLLISVAAGISLELIHKFLPENPVVRAMPNTSSAVMRSMTGLVEGLRVKEHHRSDVEEIFGAVGKFVWIPEEQMNSLMAISGSGPAYFYLFTEGLVKAGIKFGFTPYQAEMLAKETIIGAAKMLEETKKSPGKLREEVTSPKGTTLEALNVFIGKGLEDIVQQAAKACRSRGEEMEREYRGE
jgi:pyrroline-5-carboxylate reductase